ncbi:MAG: ComEA family DNA-binding protein [Actinomycetota bacterium]|nr:ComEA family DNA-binding protein [Actinomycetota bacterium]
MPVLERRRLAFTAALLAVVAALGARELLADGRPSRAEPTVAFTPGPPPGSDGAPAPAEADGARLTVHVAGAVRRPGVYRLRAGARVDDAVRRAGGASRGADLTGVNLAARVEDGRQVVVPVVGAAPGATPAAVSLSTATEEELDGLDGVGPAIARRILAYRDEHGGFRSVDELGEVPGIGEKRLEALKPLVAP